jgi:hypothetical protein
MTRGGGTIWLTPEGQPTEREKEENMLPDAANRSGRGRPPPFAPCTLPCASHFRWLHLS